MKISGTKLTIEQFLLAGCLDALRAIVWQNGGGKGQRPEPLLDILLDKKEQVEVVTFDSPEAFERAYQALQKEI